MSNFYIEEKAHLSLITYLKGEFGNVTKVTDSFADEELTIPTLAIDLTTINFTSFQIGDYNKLRELVWILDIYGINKIQRNSIAYKAAQALEKNIPILDFDLGFPPTSIPQIGVLVLTDLKIELLKIDFEEIKDLYYRAVGFYSATIQLS